MTPVTVEEIMRSLIRKHHFLHINGASIEWGDGVLYNREKVGQEMLAQVHSGLLAPERYLGWYYEQPCGTAEQRRRIRAEYMPELSSVTGGDGEE